MIRLLLVAPSRQSLNALSDLVAPDDRIRVVQQSTDMESIADHESHDPADLIVCIADDVARLRAVLSSRDHAEAAPVLALINSADDAALIDLLRFGVRGLLARDADTREILAAIDAALSGLTVLSPAAVTRIARGHRLSESAPRHSRATAAALSPRESEILGLVAEGLGNKVVAARLGISEHTVKTHVASMFQKLGADTRAEAVAIGARSGLILL